MSYQSCASDVRMSVFVRYTPCSRKVYEMAIRFDPSSFEKVREYIEQKYDLHSVERHDMVNFGSYPFKYIYAIGDYGWIGMCKDCLVINDREYSDLCLAETIYPKIIKKPDLKKWQRKYKNPLFYDANPNVR